MPHSKTSHGKLLRISSQDRQIGQENAEFSVILNNSPYVQNTTGLVVKSVSFKHVFPNIYEGNSEFLFTYNGTPETCVIPVGWYDITTLAAALELAINALPAVINVITVAPIVDPPGVAAIQKKLIFTASGGDIIGLVSRDTGNSMGDVCGITLSTAESASVIADSMTDLGGISVVYLCSDASDGNSSASSNGGESVPVLTEIPITAGYTEQIHYRSHDDDLDSIIYPSKRSLTRISLRLCTRSGQALDLKQHNLTVMLKILPYERRAHD
jgi:hypothetical protein